VSVLGLAGLVVLGLLAVSPAYGFHRDELYFIVAGRHPALGYDDQPPLTPLLSAAAVALLGLEPWAARILPALVIGASIVVTALIARELGGTRRAQIVAAVVFAASAALGAGHLAATATFDILAWTLVLCLVGRVLGGGDPRLWLGVGLAGGVGLLNKDTPLVLAAGLVLALLVHRRDLLRSRWPWLGALLALVLWLPNLAWQAANAFPQLEMARQIAGSTSLGDFAVEVLLLAGPLLFPVSVAGLWRLERRPELRPFRPLGTAFLVVLAAVIVTGGKSYYVFGGVAPLMAAGAISVDRWIGGSRARAALFGAVAALSGAITAVLVLPVLPASTLASSGINDLYHESGEQVGWPELASSVEGVVGALPPDDQARAVIVTSNYGEYGALVLLGTGAAPVYSGHNSTWSWGTPPDGAAPVVLVGWSQAYAGRWFDGCVEAARIANAVDVANDERGLPVLVCSGPREPWSQLWPELHFLS
jgi:hypothetical protein